ncbi:MAG: hypothetical protein J1E31_03755 [Helicobacter sp.]|nr:hypothetical protein [Helicobacter sp.]
MDSLLTQENITKTKETLKKRKKLYPREWLERSLAYNPYQPREIQNQIKKTLHFTPKNLYYLALSDDFLNHATNLSPNASAFVLEDLEQLTFTRRYVSNPLLFRGLIFEEYQILEALVFGADGIFLYPCLLDLKELKHLSNFAYKLGLEIIFSLQNPKDLTQAILSKADILEIFDPKLISLIPHDKILLSPCLNPIPEGIDCLILNPNALSS